MGSGCFPIKDERLTQAIKLVEQAMELLIDEYWQEVYSGESGGMQFDNAASDGAALAILGAARDLITRERHCNWLRNTMLTLLHERDEARRALRNVVKDNIFVPDYPEQDKNYHSDETIEKECQEYIEQARAEIEAEKTKG